MTRLYLRELKKLVFSTAALAASLFFVFGTGIPFFALGTNLTVSASGFRQYVSLIPYVACIVLPALTMGLWADEEKSGTYLLLLGFPLRDAEITLAKFLSVLTLYSVFLLFTLPVALLAPVAAPASRFIHSGPGSVIAAYIILFLSGAAYISIGLLLSIVSRNAVISFLVSSAALIPFTRFSFARHFEAASRGVIDSRDLVFYAIPCAAFLYLSVVALYLRRKRP